MKWTAKVAEVSTEDLAGNFLKLTRVAVKCVSVGVEVPNPGGVLGPHLARLRSKVARVAELHASNRQDRVPI